MSQRTPFPHPRILVPSAGAALRSAAATAIIVALTSALPIAAEAQYRGPRADPEVARGDLPNTFTERPLTLPKLTMRWTLGAQAFRVDPGGGADEDYFVLAGGGFAFGILDELELGVGAGPISPFFADGGEIAGLSLSVYPTDDIDFQPPFAYLRARLVGSSGFELGVDGGFIAPVNGADPTIVVSLPMRIRGGQSFALDANFGADDGHRRGCGHDALRHHLPSLREPGVLLQRHDGLCDVARQRGPNHHAALRGGDDSPPTRGDTSSTSSCAAGCPASFSRERPGIRSTWT